MKPNLKCLEPTKPAIRFTLSVHEFCNGFGFGKSKFYQEVRLGRIHVIKAGRRTFIPVEEAETYLNLLKREGSGQ